MAVFLIISVVHIRSAEDPSNLQAPVLKFDEKYNGLQTKTISIKNVDSRCMYWRFASAPNGVSANLERGFLKSGQLEIVDFSCSAYGETWSEGSIALLYWFTTDENGENLNKDEFKKVFLEKEKKGEIRRKEIKVILEELTDSE